MGKLLKLLKSVPIDFAQESVAEKTKGKQIAKSLVPDATKKQNKKALDVGCRKGVQSIWLESKGYDVTSIDIEKNYRKCRIVDANKKLPFRKNSFDLVWCSEVIEHLNNPEKSISEFRR